MTTGAGRAGLVVGVGLPVTEIGICIADRTAVVTTDGVVIRIDARVLVRIAVRMLVRLTNREVKAILAGRVVLIANGETVKPASRRGRLDMPQVVTGHYPQKIVILIPHVLTMTFANIRNLDGGGVIAGGGVDGPDISHGLVIEHRSHKVR
ncbi:hypothetical protein PG987_008671 [Apiospora arundinis]